MSWKFLENQKKKEKDLVYILLVNAQVRHISFMVEDWIPSSHLFLLGLVYQGKKDIVFSFII
jgi:hypothetical protein